MNQVILAKHHTSQASILLNEGASTVERHAAEELQRAVPIRVAARACHPVLAQEQFQNRPTSAAQLFRFRDDVVPFPGGSGARQHRRHACRAEMNLAQTAGADGFQARFVAEMRNADTVGQRGLHDGLARVRRDPAIVYRQVNHAVHLLAPAAANVMP